MTVVITLQGLQPILKATDPTRLTQALDRAVERAAEAMRDETKKLPPVSAARTGYGAKGIPVDTGGLRQSIQKRKRALLVAEVYTGAHYGKFVHDGTSKVPPRPFFKWLVEDFEGKARLEELVTNTLKQFLG